MNKKTITTTLLLTMISFNANANSEYSTCVDTRIKQYVSGKFGYVKSKIDGYTDATVQVGPLSHTQTIYDRDFDKDSYGWRIAYGLKKAVPNIYGGIRMEAEFGYLTNSASYGISTIKSPNPIMFGDITEKYKVSARAYSGMINMYYDLDTGTRFTPYVGAGLGYARTNTKGTIGHNKFDVREDNFAWNLNAGVSYKLTESFDLDLAYRYSDYGDAYARLRGNVSLKPPMGPSVTAPTIGNMKNEYQFHEMMLGLRYNF